jgi:hypothetical protein
VIRDAAGIAVDLSCESVDPEHPETHALGFLHFLVNDHALAGQEALEKVLKRLYTAVFCPRQGTRPLPWLSVLRHFNKLLKVIYGPTPFKTYESVYKRGRRRKLRAYRIPRLEEAAQRPEQQSDVVEEETWSGDLLRFRVRALGQVAAGNVEVAEDHVQLEVTLPCSNVAIVAGLCDRSWEFMNCSGCTRGLADAEGYGVGK